MKPLTKTVLLLLCLLGSEVWGAQVQYEVLTSFEPPNGSSPRGNLVQGADGSFYGTT